MEPEKIRKLLAAPPENLEKVAKKLELPLPLARDIRVQAMNLVLGRCVLCGKHTLLGMCAHCRKSAPHRRRIPWNPIELLKKLKPSDQLLRQVCDRCDRPFMLSANYLLKKLLRNRSKHEEESKRTCNGCIEREKEAARRAEMKRLEDEKKQRITQHRKAAEERKKKLADEARKKQAVQDFLDKRSTKLSYKPFAGNEELVKLKNELKKAPSRRRHQKGPKRA